MNRHILEELLEWKNRERRSPLILVGARQVGKTWLMKEFGKKHFKNTAYISFDSNPKLNETLENTMSPPEILAMLQSETGVVITKETLIIFDEIQDSPRALLSLKYFCENAPEYHIIAAGSALGVMLHQNKSFPVGKVEFLNVYPFSFFEFLDAVGEGELCKYICQNSPDKYKPFHEKLIRYLRVYLFIGGMPGVLAEYVKSGSFEKARNVQNSILDAYERDFSKYAGKELFETRLRMLWYSVPQQLAKENKRFVYGDIKSGARGRDFDTAIQWMKDSSLIGKVHRVKAPKMPLRVYEDLGAFKIFINDVGLLCAMAKIKVKHVSDKEALFMEFNGAIAEQFVFQELRLALRGEGLCYWANENGSAEIDFLTEDSDGCVIPIEVKSGINLRAKSLSFFVSKYEPKYSIRTSLADYKINQPNNIIDMPIYAVAKIKDFIM